MPSKSPDRRAFLTVAAGAALAAPGMASAAAAAEPPPPPPRDWASGEPGPYPDPHIVALDPRFEPLLVWNTPLRRIYTGGLWLEGPAWNAPGRFLMWSDIPNAVQMRWLEEDGHVSTFRTGSGNSNGNTFDYQGRQLSCEHGGRRVVRYELDGSVTVIADRFDGKRLNSPNDVVVHPDGGIWFTDPIFGIAGNYEGFKAAPEQPPSVYRVDAGGRIARVAEVSQANGLCFSPDYRRLYVTTTGPEVLVFDVDGATARNRRTFATLDIPGTGQPSSGDGLRCDRDGNLWIGARPGVQVLTPGGERIGMIRTPEVCANVCFGGPKRNRLFMASSQSIYALYVGAQGAHIA